jgi:hypothetical protein
MYYSIRERIVHLLGKKISSKDESAVLQTRIWLENIFRTYGIGRHELSGQIGAVGAESTGIVLKWLKGIHAAKKGQVKKMASIFEGSDYAYELPLFKLFMDKPISKAQLNRIMEPYIFTSGLFKLWKFPYPDHSENKGRPFPPCLINDTEALIERGDLYGFTAILYLLRMAETERDALNHAHYVACAYSALPSLCRQRLFTKRWKEVLDCLRSLHYRLPTSILLVRPIVPIIRKQIFSAEHITRQSLRPRDPVTGTFTELELPYQTPEYPKISCS